MPRRRQGPRGPEDDTAGAEFTLSRDQFDRLRSVVPKKHLSIRLRDRGAAWAEIEMLDAEGAVIESWPLPPVIPRVTERARLRAIDSGRAAKEYAARRAAEAPDPAPTSPQEPV